ncbi:MAG: rRNA (guanine1207-N2)-methyltransferase, partial [Actinomycetota bacterium]|nr:rRNA (guanine1207-N2)-methyltransferase [Actinomycetota bacterium]
MEALRRFPDREAPELQAWDATDALLLDSAAAELESAAPGQVVVIGDGYGALALGAIGLHGASDVRVHQDSLAGELALARNAGETGSFRSLPLGQELLSGARVVLLQLPKSLAELEEIAEAIARFADPAVAVFAGGRIKHLTLAMNDVFRAYFGRFDVLHARS